MTSSSNLRSSSMFFLFLSGTFLLLFSLWFPPTQALWRLADIAVFRWCNDSLAFHPVQQTFWAAASIKITDLFGALFLLGFFLLYVFEAHGEERRVRVAKLLYTLIWFEIAMLFCKQLMTPLLISLGYMRHSPTETLSNTFRLSTVLPCLKIKDSSLFSFPADHGAIVFLWCGFLWFFASWKKGLLAFLFSIIFIMPRLVSGAHWLSDLLVGSVSWVLFLMSIALFSPIYTRSMRYLTTFTAKKNKKGSNGSKTL